MAVIRRFGITPELDMEQILREAQHRWLRPAEICEILRNYRNFHIAPEPPNRPHSGLLFLFDRKVLRYFRKDGHSWRKKKDGKTVKEAHERLKVGSVDVLHCYYAHGEENENFQRRSYWLLEEDLMHIVLVHYREVQSTKSSSSRNRDGEEISQSTETGTPLSSNLVSNPKSSMRSQTTGVDSLGSVHTSEYEDPEPDNHHAVSRYHPCPEHQDSEQPVRDSSNLNTYFTVPSSITDEFSSGSKLCDGPGSGVDFDFLEDCMTESSRLADDLNSVVMDSCKIDVSCQVPLSYESGCDIPKVGGSSKHTLFKQISMEISNTEDDCRLRKCDSFCKWMSKELEEVNDPQIQLSSPHNWIQVETENLVRDSENNDLFLLSPALSQDQLFSIIDFSPQWGYAGIETKVLVMGSFLKDMVDVGKCDWSCMFGEIEVPAQVIADGVLRCHAPVHKPGLVHFYVTSSNRLACSEIREFEYMEIPDSWCGSESEYLFHLRLMKLLSIGYDQIQQSASYLSSTKLRLSNKVNSLLRDEDDGWSTILNPEEASCLLLERLLKQKLRDWLLCKIAEDGKGASVLDEEGQGVLHLASALGYDWAIAPTVSAGVSVDFRDTRGWTALHWAASCGRERTVVALFSLDAAPGALTDPTPEFPPGRTPADLASINGHKGIAGFLAESSLTKHLAILTLKDLVARNTAASTSSIEAFVDVERTATRAIDQNMDVGLCAIRKAALAAARIHQVFRVESFQRKKLSDLARVDDEYSLPIVPPKSKKYGQSDGSLAAVIRIQNKFRGWKGRKEFLITRQRIIKIQAHVRGHLVRKHNANNILWSVGIVEKIILRWRRKGNGLRGFRSQALTDRSGPHGQTSQLDDFDFLKEGRKQAEAKTDQALARVNSMVQHPEARDQYRRLLNALEELQESKELLENNDPDASEGKMMFDDPLIN